MSLVVAVAEPAVKRSTQVATRRPYLERYADLAIAAGFSVLVFCVHPLGQVFGKPFWLDEAWVANLAKAPLSRQVELSSSSPVGWMLLLRIVPGDAAQRFRLVPLTFSVAVVVLAYFFVRGLNWRNTIEARCAGVIASAAAALAPISLVRNDLKQYTSDAAFTLLILLLGRNAEQDRSRRSLIVLSIASVAAIPFSTVAGLVTIAVFTGLLGSASLQKSWHRLREILICGAASGIGIVAYVGAVVLPHDNQKLRDYWRAFYLPGGLTHALSTAWHRFANLGLALGGPPIAVLVLGGLGLAVLAIRGHVALVIAVIVLWLEMFALGVAGRYPFLNLRTSHFLLIVSVVTASIGLTVLAFAVVRYKPSVMITLTLALVGSMALGARNDIRRFGVHPEDARTQARYVAAHRTAEDVVVVNLSGNYGFTYYWPGPEPKTYHYSAHAGAAFVARVDNINAIYADDRTEPAIWRALHDAITDVQGLDGQGHIWIVRSHAPERELRAWKDAFRALDLHPVPVTQTIEPLLVVDVPRRTRVPIAGSRAPMTASQAGAPDQYSR